MGDRERQLHDLDPERTPPAVAPNVNPDAAFDALRPIFNHNVPHDEQVRQVLAAIRAGRVPGVTTADDSFLMLRMELSKLSGLPAMAGNAAEHVAMITMQIAQLKQPLAAEKAARAQVEAERNDWMESCYINADRWVSERERAERAEAALATAQAERDQLDAQLALAQTTLRGWENDAACLSEGESITFVVTALRERLSRAHLANLDLRREAIIMRAALLEVRAWFSDKGHPGTACSRTNWHSDAQLKKFFEEALCVRKRQ